MPNLIEQPYNHTVRKVQAATIAAAICSLIVALLMYFVPAWAGPEASTALLLLVSPVITPLVAWAAGYYTRAREGEIGQ